MCAGLELAGQIAVASIENAPSAIHLAPLVRFSTPFLSLSLAVTLYTTGLIAWRITYVQRYAKKQDIKKEVKSEFSPVLELLIESSAVYAASLLVFVVLLALKSPNQNYTQNINVQIAVCPIFLAVYLTDIHQGYSTYVADISNLDWPCAEGRGVDIAELPITIRFHGGNLHDRRPSSLHGKGGSGREYLSFGADGHILELVG